MNEQKIIVCILQHTLHRINEFLDEHPNMEADADPAAISTDFARWLSKKDAHL